MTNKFYKNAKALGDAGVDPHRALLSGLSGESLDLVRNKVKQADGYFARRIARLLSEDPDISNKELGRILKIRPESVARHRAKAEVFRIVDHCQNCLTRKTFCGQFVSFLQERKWTEAKHAAANFGCLTAENSAAHRRLAIADWEIHRDTSVCSK